MCTMAVSMLSRELYNRMQLMISEDRLAWPELDRMTSTGKEANGDPGNAEARYPTGEEIKFISASEAAKLWDDRVQRISGLTWLFNDGQCASLLSSQTLLCL